MYKVIIAITAGGGHYILQQIGTDSLGSSLVIAGMVVIGYICGGRDR